MGCNDAEESNFEADDFVGIDLGDGSGETTSNNRNGNDLIGTDNTTYKTAANNGGIQNGAAARYAIMVKEANNRTNGNYRNDRDGAVDVDAACATNADGADGGPNPILKRKNDNIASSYKVSFDMNQSQQQQIDPQQQQWTQRPQREPQHNEFAQHSRHLQHQYHHPSTKPKKNDPLPTSLKRIQQRKHPLPTIQDCPSLDHPDDESSIQIFGANLQNITSAHPSRKNRKKKGLVGPKDGNGKVWCKHWAGWSLWTRSMEDTFRKRRRRSSVEGGAEDGELDGRMDGEEEEDLPLISNPAVAFLAPMEHWAHWASNHLKKVDFQKLALMTLAALAFLLMEYGTSGSESFLDSTINLSTHSNSYLKSNSAISGASTFQTSGGFGGKKNGYQAQIQAPIPAEYSNFVELSDFANAVTVVRLHRQKILQQKEQQSLQKKQQLGHRQLRIQEDVFHTRIKNIVHRRLDENNEEEEEMNNAIDNAWEQAMQTNPELEQQRMKKEVHIPFFFHIPRSGGTTFSYIFSQCLSLVQATSSLSSPPLFQRGEDEALASRFRDPSLYKIRTQGQQFVNVDLDSWQGVQRAAKGGLIEKELAEVVAVPDIRLGSLLFGKSENNKDSSKGEDEVQSGDGDESEGQQVEYKGVIFAMFREPVERSISLFYYKQSVQDSVLFDPSLAIYSLTDWINSPSYMTDYMTRTLVGKIDTRFPLTREDLDIAKEILRRKCIIGLLDEKGESMKRFEKFFGWNAEVRRDSLLLFEEEDSANAIQAERWKNQIVKDEECIDRLLHWQWMNKHKHPMVEEDSLAFKLLESKNRYDIELYLYARQLFDEQYMQLGFDDEGVDGDLDGLAFMNVDGATG